MYLGTHSNTYYGRSHGRVFFSHRNPSCWAQFVFLDLVWGERDLFSQMDLSRGGQEIKRVKRTGPIWWRGPFVVSPPRAKASLCSEPLPTGLTQSPDLELIPPRGTQGANWTNTKPRLGADPSPRDPRQVCKLRVGGRTSVASLPGRLLLQGSSPIPAPLCCDCPRISSQ